VYQNLTSFRLYQIEPVGSCLYFLVTHVRGKTVHIMLVFIGLVCISSKGPLLGKVLSICALQVHIFMGCYIVTYLLGLSDEAMLV